jgi:3-isopropylmalate dehydratase small subunit
VAGLVPLAACEKTIEQEAQDVREAEREGQVDVATEQQDVREAARDAAENIKDEQRDVQDAAKDADRAITEEERELEDAKRREAEKRVPDTATDPVVPVDPVPPPTVP